jgi:hypothetical protein
MKQCDCVMLILTTLTIFNSTNFPTTNTTSITINANSYIINISISSSSSNIIFIDLGVIDFLRCPEKLK